MYDEKFIFNSCSSTFVLAQSGHYTTVFSLLYHASLVGLPSSELCLRVEHKRVPAIAKPIVDRTLLPSDV